MPLVIVVDYDNTIVKDSYPDNGRFRFLAQTVLKWLMKRNILILNTCRENDTLRSARSFLISHGIYFNYYNQNAQYLIDQYGDCRKIAGDLILDDKALFPGWIFVPLIVLWLEWRSKNGSRK